MKIERLKTNHIVHPLGYAMEQAVLSYVVSESSGKRQKQARILVALDERMQEIVYDSGMTEEIDSIAYPLPISLKPATRYYWKVTVLAEDGDTGESDVTWFETAKPSEELPGDFITAKPAEHSDAANPGMDVAAFFTTWKGKPGIKRAKARATALGVYELSINGKKAGNEFLTPYSNDYDSWLQFQTFDVTKLLQTGKNEVVMTVAPGWYSGYFGFEGKHEIYGDKKAAFLNLEVCYEDGSRELLVTDESWKVRESAVRYAELYHGEVYDATFEPKEVYDVTPVCYPKERLSARRSLPVVIKETITPIGILHTPAGETVIDMGQNMVGWLSFFCRAPKGTRLHFQYGELLQDGNFYRENLRTAKAEFTYISDGTERWVRPHFTYYGFRYVKLEGIVGEPEPDDFMGEVIYSDMEVIGGIETNHPLVNRLVQNALWGQKGNFVDVPTDCPQRDERMGWTGDAQIFSGTAAFFMDVYAFYAKYGYDMLREQERCEGCVPMVIPSFHMGPGGSAAWADAATVLPWTTYLYSGDVSILKQQYPSMKLWVDYVHRQDVEHGDKGLWQSGFHFGDWLALDGTNPEFPTGATEPYYVASSYYFLSVTLLAKAAEILGKKDDAIFYGSLAAKIKKALQNEYFTPDGKLTQTTQTSYVLALAFGFCPKGCEKAVAGGLNERIKKDGGKLATGFVGTPFICRVLSEYGYNDTAYQLLLREDCPGWLYPVRMGATTIWERWNSILPDGKINPEGMNSLNHYSYGAVAEWMFRYMVGIWPLEEAPGFRRIRLQPMPDSRLTYAKGYYDSPVGRYESGWRFEGNTVHYSFVIPFGGSAELTLPDARAEEVRCNGEEPVEVRQQGNQVWMLLTAGSYELTYRPV